MSYDRLTRALHLLIAIGVLAQLIISEVMIYPKHGREGDAFYSVHEALGEMLLVVLVIHWIWRILQTSNVAFSCLFPWFSRYRYAEIWEDTKRFATHITQLRLPPDTLASPLPCAIQGLGLSIATVLGLSGTILFFAMDKNGKMVGWVHTFKEIHEVFGGLIWVYLVAHASMGILHQLAGHGSLRVMARFWEKTPYPPTRPE